MAEIDVNGTLGDLVTANPDMAAPLERLGLDYCCGGGRRLVDAAGDAGLDLEAVVATLAAIDDRATPVEWSGLDPADLVDHVERTHHVFLRDELPRLEALVAKVEGVHGGRHAELADVRRLVVELRADLEPHLREEEEVLFPMIRASAAGREASDGHDLSQRIRAMEAEHDRVGELLAELRAVTDGFVVPPDGCASYDALYRGLAGLESDTHLHVHKENNVLFPALVAAGPHT